jgi:hypothetical protein
MKTTLSNIKNVDVPQPVQTKLIEKISVHYINREKENIKKWRDATERAEDVLMPDRADLMRIYRDVILDAHVSSVMSSLLNSVLQSQFIVMDGEKPDEKTKTLLESKWFRDFVRYAVESRFYGFSLVQLGNIVENALKNIELVPRENVIPNKRSIKKHVLNALDLISYDQPKFEKWVIPIGDEKDLGLLHKITPWALWKKDVTVAWAEYAEVFGMPMRIGRTNINNPDAKANMNNMLANMGRGGWATIDESDMIEFLQLNKTDAFEIYKQFINIADEQISKIVLGQTMTTENGSSRSQSEVHERVGETYTTACKMFVMNVVNDQLLPILKMHGVISGEPVFKWDYSEKLTLLDKWKITEGLLTNYTIAPEKIQEMFGIEVEEKQTPDNAQPLNPDQKAKAKAMLDEVDNFYKGHKAKVQTNGFIEQVRNFYKGIFPSK